MTEPLHVPRRLGVTGTDTGVGKTVVSCALAARARQLGLRVAAMKPLESGVEARASDADATRLAAACGGNPDLALVRPYLLREPLAPWVAAEREGQHIDVARLAAARDALERDQDLLIVEGAGGLLVPITAELAYDGLFASWHCELVIVAANRLGVLNHTRLTVQAARAAGLAVRAVVLTSLHDGAEDVAQASHPEALHRLCPDVPLYRFPFVPVTDDLSALAHAAQTAGLDALLGSADPTILQGRDTLRLQPSRTS